MASWLRRNSRWGYLKKIKMVNRLWKSNILSFKCGTKTISAKFIWGLSFFFLVSELYNLNLNARRPFEIMYLKYFFLYFPNNGVCYIEKIYSFVFWYTQYVSSLGIAIMGGKSIQVSYLNRALDNRLVTF